MSSAARRFGNARYVRNLLEAAIGRQAWRLRDVEKPTVAELRTLAAEDLDPIDRAGGDRMSQPATQTAPRRSRAA